MSDQPTPPPSGFVDPYEPLWPSDLPSNRTLFETMVRVGAADHRLITTVHTARPVMRKTVSILISRLCYELRKHGITEYDPAAYERAVGGLTILLGGTAVPTARPDSGVGSTEPNEQPDRQTAGGDDRCGPSRVARSDDGTHPVTADAPVAPQRAKRQKAGKRTGTGHQ